MLTLWWSGVMEGKAAPVTGVAEPCVRKGSRAPAESQVRCAGRRLDVLEPPKLEEEDVESRW